MWNAINKSWKHTRGVDHYADIMLDSIVSECATVLVSLRSARRACSVDQPIVTGVCVPNAPTDEPHNEGQQHTGPQNDVEELRRVTAHVRRQIQLVH